MKLKDIFTDQNTLVFIVTDQSDDNELNWSIEPTNFELIPEEENIYFVKALQVSSNATKGCYLGIMMPERIAESVIKNANGHIISESIFEQNQTIIPAVASEGFGDYELYYAKENPQTGIDILRAGLEKATNKNVAAEDLGYILRDEKRIEEAIEAFTISVENGPSSEFIYQELSNLYKETGMTAEQKKYEQKFKENC